MTEGKKDHMNLSIFLGGSQILEHLTNPSKFFEPKKKKYVTKDFVISLESIFTKLDPS